MLNVFTDGARAPAGKGLKLLFDPLLEILLRDELESTVMSRPSFPSTEALLLADDCEEACAPAARQMPCVVSQVTADATASALIVSPATALEALLFEAAATLLLEDAAALPLPLPPHPMTMTAAAALNVPSPANFKIDIFFPC